MYLSFDPGHATGYAIFDEAGEIKDFGTLQGDTELFDFLSECDPPNVVIVEEFRLYRQKALQQSGSRLETVQAIGMIKTFAKQWKAKVVEQPASIKVIAERWSGVSPKGAHKNSHWVDAMNHGVYYLQKNGIIESRLLKDKREGKF